jgi:hypothetical protein
VSSGQPELDGRPCLKNHERDGHRWLTFVILTTQEAEIRRIMVRSQPRQIVWRPYLEKTLHKKGLVGVVV